MKTIIFAVAAITALSGCGYDGRDTEVRGQVKRIMHNIPLICGDFSSVDISLGLFVNGNGSASKEDMWINVTREQEAVLRQAADQNRRVKIVYDSRRLSFCRNLDTATSITIL